MDPKATGASRGPVSFGLGKAAVDRRVYFLLSMGHVSYLETRRAPAMTRTLAINRCEWMTLMGHDCTDISRHFPWLQSKESGEVEVEVRLSSLSQNPKKPLSSWATQCIIAAPWNGFCMKISSKNSSGMWEHEHLPCSLGLRSSFWGIQRRTP